MKNYSAKHELIDEILKFAATRTIAHRDFIDALMMVIYSDLSASDRKGTALVNEDGELLLDVKRFT